MCAEKKKKKRGLPVTFNKYNTNTNTKSIAQKRWTQGASTATNSSDSAEAWDLAQGNNPLGGPGILHHSS